MRSLSLCSVTLFVFLFGQTHAWGEDPVAQVESGATCLIGDHPGIEDSDAETATSLICDELRAQGVDVGSPTDDAPASGDAYRVTVRRLGQLIFLELSHESPVGAEIASRETQLAGIEEVAVAAPRIAQSLVQNLPFEETAQMDSLIGQETREIGQRDGETFWGIGIMGMGAIGTDVIAAPGFILKFFYEAPRFVIGSDMLFAGGSASGDDNVLFFSWSVGAGYFFNLDNIGFFAGGGLAWDTIGTYRGENQERGGISSGLGAYGTAGIEAMRHYGSRLIAALRVDVPFFTVDEEFDLANGNTASDTVYVIPISINVVYAW